MKRKVCFSLLLSILIFGFLNIVSAETIYVDDDGGADYTSIQDAIDNANSGDTIYVYSGTYHENITIDKQIILKGEDKLNSFIDSEDRGNAIYIDDVQGVEIRNLNITADRKYYDTDASIMYSGIRIKSASHLIIDNCIITNCPSYAIYYEFSGRECHNITISNNLIQGDLGGINKGSHSVDNFLINNTILGEGESQDAQDSEQEDDADEETIPDDTTNERQGTPGFELILAVCAIALVLFLKKRKK